MAPRILIKLGSQFPTLGANVVTIKYYLFLEIYKRERKGKHTRHWIGSNFLASTTLQKKSLTLKKNHYVISNSNLVPFLEFKEKPILSRYNVFTLVTTNQHLIFCCCCIILWEQHLTTSIALLEPCWASCESELCLLMLWSLLNFLVLQNTS